MIAARADERRVARQTELVGSRRQEFLVRRRVRAVAAGALSLAHGGVYEAPRELRLLVLVTGEARRLRAAVRLVA